MRTTRLLALAPLAVLAAACGGGSHPAASGATATLAPSATPSASPTDSSSPTPTPSASPSDQCQTSQLTITLGQGGGAAGSVYEPIVFTNKGSSECTLYGYPGVAFVAPSTGAQVGAAASRNPQQASTTVTLAAGASASSLLQIADYQNYPTSSCSPVAVSGLRVYTPGDKDASYVAFKTATQACSTQVNQLTVQAVVAGSSGGQ